MKRNIKSLFEPLLGNFGAFACALTDRDRVESLIKSMHPFVSKKALIRLGPKTDGGYLIPEDLDGITSCFSPGVSQESGFEYECAERGMRVFLADKSVDGPATAHPNFHFTKKFLGVLTDENFMTLDTWVADCEQDSKSDLLLQIDIEGFEYEVILGMSDSLLQRFRIIVAEFHSLHQLWNAPFFGLAEKAFRKILQSHACVHIHPNNCCGSTKRFGIEIPRVMEFTFQRRDRLRCQGYQTRFPNSQDFENTANPPLALPRCWYKQGV